jgi:hypothetical protein
MYFAHQNTRTRPWSLNPCRSRDTAARNFVEADIGHQSGIGSAVQAAGHTHLLVPQNHLYGGEGPKWVPSN